MKLSPFFSQNSNFVYSLYGFWDFFVILVACTLYNVLSHRSCGRFEGRGLRGVGAVDIQGVTGGCIAK